MKMDYKTYSDDQVMEIFGRLPKGIRRAIAFASAQFLEDYSKNKEEMLADDRDYNDWDLDWMSFCSFLGKNKEDLKDFEFIRSMGLRRQFCKVIRESNFFENLMLLQ
jgi:hypothetical protein